jgi:hypothetical protein
MYQLTLLEAQKQLPFLINAALQGENFFITQENNEPIVQLLVSIKIQKNPKIFGIRINHFCHCAITIDDNVHGKYNLCYNQHNSFCASTVHTFLPSFWIAS